ncbi:YwqI/YxiC family protein [Bacillus sp. NPDC077027]|uniref:YwqI/YxiC family protein n=1 Tax=Bacillus sp. NPDC077027 TaxID=3390548 RepID=UPI003D0346AC
MDREIKMDASHIKRELNNAKQAGSQMKSSLPKTIKGKNQLSTIEKIEKINHQLNELSTAYTDILQKQLAQTEQAVNTMIETDKALASASKRK